MICPKPLKGLDGDLCERPLDTKRGLGLCAWHTDEKLGLVHHDDYPGACAKSDCIECGEKPIAFRVTKLCGVCHRRFVRHRQRNATVVRGYIVER